MNAAGQAGEPSVRRKRPPTLRRQLRDEAAAYIRELISAGEAHPGTLLRLAPLAEALDISATPVREALLLLDQEGWVSQEPNRGFRVTVPDRQDTLDAYFVLAFLSGELAARAAANANEEDVAELRRLDREVNSLTPDEGARAQRLNTAIHAQIGQVAESQRLDSFVALTTRYVPRRFWYVVPHWIEFNKTGHAAVIDAIEARKAARAKKAMSDHVNQAAELLMAHLDATDFWTASS